jgi:uncharacterized membrane protein
MLRKILVGSAVAGLLALGAGTASAQATEPAAPWMPVFYFGTQTYCTSVGNFGQQTGTLTAGTWKCDSGWLMVQAPDGD